MQAIFLCILNMSITAGWLVLAVILIRGLFKSAPKAFRVVLWGLVGVRLLLPFSVESGLSLIPRTEVIPMEIAEIGDVVRDDEAENLPGDGTIGNLGGIVGGEKEQKQDDINLPEIIVQPDGEAETDHWAAWLLTGAVMLWIAGMAVMVGYTVISYLRIGIKVREAVPFKDNMLFCDRIDTPFILGMLCPKIYLPSDMNESDMAYVVAHEQAHLIRKDHWWKPIGFILLTIHWFNPLLWVAYILLCRDIELACDERVIRSMGVESKKQYSDALINCSVPRRLVAACPLAFGEVSVKNRVKSVLDYKKPTFWALVAAVVVCVGVALCFLTDPNGNNLDERLQVLIDCEIANHNQSVKSGENFCCVDWEVLGTEKKGDRLTIYLWTLYLEYSYDDGIKEESGSHIPVAITVEKNGGSYATVEYWMPRDGSYWVEDIRGKFPMSLWGKATDSQRYIKEQLADCERMAKEHFAETVISDEEYDVRFEYKDSVDYLPPYILLNTKEQRFEFKFSGFSSYLPCGNYRITKDGTLVLDAGSHKYRFALVDGAYVFDANLSSTIPQYNYGANTGMKTPVPDGARFELVRGEMPEVVEDAPQDTPVFTFGTGERIEYIYRYSVEWVDPCIALYPKDQSFIFTHSTYSSFFFVGNYQKEDDILTLRVYGSETVLKFREVEGNYVFLAEESTKLPGYRYAASESEKISTVPDGAVFELVMPDEKLNLNEPPRLVVVQAHEMVEAAEGNSEWDCEQADGTRCHIIACGSTMYENRDRLNVLNLGEKDPMFVWLQFGVDPDKITVTCWNLDEENPEAEAIETEDVWSVDLKDGNYVYEIKAEWTRFSRFNGTVEYGFRTVKNGNTSN